MKRFVLGLSLVAAALGAGALGAAGQDEDAAWAAALEKFNRGQAAEARLAFEKYCADFPRGKRFAEALFKGGQCEFNLRRFPEARARLGAYLEKSPQGPDAPQGQHLIAAAFARENRRADAAAEYKKLFKNYPGTPPTQNALWQYWNLVEKQFSFSVHQSFTEGEEVRVQWYLSNIDRVKYRLYRLESAPLLERVARAREAPDVHALLSGLPRKLLREWSEDPHIGRRQYKNGSIKLEIAEAGQYLFEAEHDEVAVHVNVLVARYGLVTKSAPDRTLVFAVDRRSGRPLPGMKLRFFGREVREGETDAQGLFVLDRPAEAGAVAGIKDGEIALAQLRSAAAAAELKAHLGTDRPVYRPGQTVHYRIAAALREGGDLRVLANARARFTIRDPRGNAVTQAEAATNEFGAFSGRLVLGDEPPLGFYSMQLEIPGRGHAYGQFRVEEYRKPEYKVEVRFQGGPYLQGDAVEGEADVRYYFGSPVVDAEVTYVVYRAAYSPAWRWRWYAYEGDWDDDDGLSFRSRGYGYGQQVLQGSGRTDKEGRLAFRFKAGSFEHDSQYRVVATAVDKSRREVTGEGSVKVSRAEFQLQISANKYVYTPGDAVTLKIRAADLDDRPVAGLRVALHAATSDWRDQRQHFDPFLQSDTLTDEHGLAEFRFAAEKQGQIRVLAEAKDKKGNGVKAESWFWVSGREWTSGFYNFNGVDLLPDKSVYLPGETARVLVTSQHKNVHVLLTVEGDTLFRHEVVHVKGHSALVEIPIDGRYSPNVTLSAAALVRNEFVTKRKSLSVPPLERLVQIKLAADKAAYRPREKAVVTLEARDAQGKPVQGEFSLGVVDESIYAVQEEFVRDVRKFFFAKRWSRVQTQTSLHFYDYGRGELAAQKGAAAPGDPAAAPGPEALRRSVAEDRKKGDAPAAATEVRGYFPDTMFWSAHVRTDASGRATFTLDVPDSLTTWRATARGLTREGRVGQEISSLLVRKEVIVRLETPRFFTQNDSTVVSAVVHNYRADVEEIRVSLEAAGVERSGEAEVRVKVPRGEDRRVDWKVNARKAGTARLTARAVTPVESDAMQLEIPVQPHGALQFEAKAGMVEASGGAAVTLPEGAIAEASELRIVVSPTVASQVVAALEYLAGYPYGCVEQTMSRFLPTVVVAQALQKLGVPFAKRDELPAMVAQGLQRLYNFQQPDGGWGWWQNDASNPYTTAYVVYGLAQAQAADFLVDPNVLARGLRKLNEHARRKDLDADTRAYVLYALAAAGQAPRDLLAGAERDGMSDYSKGLVAWALHRAGAADGALAYLADLDASAKEGETHCSWEGRGTRWHWMNNRIEATAHILRAYLALRPDDPKIAKVVRWLSLQRHGDRWHSTKDTAAAVLALVEYVARTRELEADYRVTVKVNGKAVLTERVTRENLFSFPGTLVLRGEEVRFGANEVTFEKEGKGSLYYSVFLKYYAGAEGFKPSKGSVRIERDYARVTWDGKQRVEEPLKDGAVVRAGDEILVTLRLEADGPHEYLMIEDPLPSGFEVVKEDRFYGWGHRRRGWGWWYARIEARDEKVCIAATTLHGGQTVQYTLRAETPGDFHVLPAYAYSMYVPEIAGSGAEMRIKVEDRP